jgi:aspartate-semialdehyde dehydrogenase
MRRIRIATYQVAQYSGCEAIARLIDQVKSHQYPRRIMCAYLMIDMLHGAIEEFEKTGRGGEVWKLEMRIAKLERRIANWWPEEIDV